MIMYRLLSLAAAERGRRKERLALSLAGICELELLKQRHARQVGGALALHARPDRGLLRATEPEPEAQTRPQEEPGPRRPTDASWSIINILQHQVGELRVDAADSSSVEPPTDAGDSRPGSGFYDQIEGLSPLGLSDSSGFSELSPRSVHPVRPTERPKSAGDVFVGAHEVNGGMRPAVPRSLSAPYPPLEGIAEGVGEDESWVWSRSSEGLEDGEPTAEDYTQAHRVEMYILGLIQRRSLPLRPSKPRTSLGPETRGVTRQSSLCRQKPPRSPERQNTPPSPDRHAWTCHGLDEQHFVAHPAEEVRSARFPRPALAGIRSTSLDFPCGVLDPSSSEAESPQHFQSYQLPCSPSSDEQLVNAQYIPAQPCRAQARTASHRTHGAAKPGRSAYSPERAPPKIRATQKKCRFTEDKTAPKKAGRKACRAQSENSLLGQRGVSERKYNTVERDVGRNAPPKTRRTQGSSSHRRWRSTLELSQDEAELPPEQPIRRSRKPRPAPPPCVYSPAPQHLHHTQHHHPPHLRAEYLQRVCLQEDVYQQPVPGESESSLSEPESPASSSLSSDSDESGGLVWPQQLPPQLAPPSPPSPAGTTPQPKAFVKIKASHALKKKILRFRTGSLKVMTTV